MTYNEFIQNIIDTRGRFACGDDYHERHHIIPRCCGGTNDENNLIDLYAREHFIAHKLLAIENPDNDKLIYAWWCMSHIKSSNQDRYELTEFEYEESKKAFIRVHSELLSGDKHPLYGKHRTEKEKNNISKNRKGKCVGNDNPNYGKHPSKETIIKMRESKKGNKNPMYGHKHSSKNRELFSIINKGKFISDETKSKISKNHADMKNEKNPSARKVIRLVDKKIYPTLKNAAEDNSLNRNTICNRCKTKNGFMYYDEYLIQQNNLENLIV